MKKLGIVLLFSTLGAISYAQDGITKNRKDGDYKFTSIKNLNAASLSALYASRIDHETAFRTISSLSATSGRKTSNVAAGYE